MSGPEQAIAAAVEQAAGDGAREVTVTIEDNRKPVRVELSTPGVSVEIEAPEPLDVVAARAMEMWREIRTAPPPDERAYGFATSGGGQHEQAAPGWDAGYDMG